MSARDLVLLSVSVTIGAVASFVACRFVSSRCNDDDEKLTAVYPPLPDVNRSSDGVLPRNPFDTSKREGYISWDDYFMAIAFLSAQRSKDPNRQVGACLVSQDDIILGIGYNGFPRRCSDDKLPWAKKSKTGDPLETKYLYVVHAEVNAILNTNHASAEGQSGVSEVIYYTDKRVGNSDAAYIASNKLLALAGVKLRKHQPQMTQILVEFQEP
ncbi:hypothetical protein ZIOFF_020083 [Zingiber officinale]|uniref:dCMP deaminase n=1 Tax=Zingiber officinale TaxID=94328 RepID=A0A8J5LC16_ZINOF|nr:hypothetical protein ZIOFF_020083 [Zingiber officinale]